MKKAVLREYLKNREAKTLTIHQDKYFTFAVDDADLSSDNDTLGNFIRKAAKEAVDIYEEKVVKPRKKAKKGDM